MQIQDCQPGKGATAAQAHRQERLRADVIAPAED